MEDNNYGTLDRVDQYLLVAGMKEVAFPSRQIKKWVI